jgi:hypothetical protein
VPNARRRVAHRAHRGPLRVTLNGQVVRIDQLIAGAFLPLPTGAPPGMLLVHLDGDCHNDAASNLRWTLPG